MSLSSLAAESPAEADAAKILGAFARDRVPPTKVSAVYKLGLSAVAVAMVILPLIYICLIVGLGWLVYAHAVGNAGIMAGSGSGTGKLIVYAGPIVIGVISIIFMIKPLFARSAAPPSMTTLKPGEEPLLEAFIEKICLAVGAPKPKSIEVDCNVNAAAGLRRGWLSLFGQDLKLIIGLPLVAGMDMRSLAGVLAHEFGHFAQGTGMRLTYIIRNINGWFARVVYQRDQMDAWLDATAKSVDLRIGIVLHLARLMVWLTRRVLWLLMQAGHAISCFALRQMEFDADSYETKLAGSAKFSATSERLQLLGIGSQCAHNLLQATWKEKRLSQNLPELIQIEADDLAEEVRGKVVEGIQNSKTGMFDTHPADRDRVAAAERIGAEGIFHLELPATLLFKDFNALARRVTESYYELALDLKVPETSLIDNVALSGERRARVAANQAIKRFFREQMSISRPMFVELSEVTGIGNTLEGLVSGNLAAREKLEAATRELDSRLKELEEADEKKIEMIRAKALVDAGLKTQAKALGLAKADPVTAMGAIEDAEMRVNHLTLETRRVEGAARQRLRDALALLWTPGFQLESDESVEDLQSEVTTLLGVVSHFKGAFPTILTLRDKYIALAALLNELSDQVETAHVSAMRDLAGQMDIELRRLEELFDRVTYPFVHAGGQISITKFMVPELNPAMDPIFHSYHRANIILDHLLQIYFRVMGRLALIAEQVEKACESGRSHPSRPLPG